MSGNGRRGGPRRDDRPGGQGRGGPRRDDRPGGQRRGGPRRDDRQGGQGRGGPRRDDRQGGQGPGGERRRDRPDRKPRSDRRDRGPLLDPARSVYGRNPVRELLRAGRRPVHRIHVAPQLDDADWLAGHDTEPATADELAELAGTGDHQGVVAECGDYPYVELAELIGSPGVVVVLDEITDPRNLGAIARSAEASGAAGLVLHDRRAAHVTATVCKTSAGAIEHLPVALVRNVADAVTALRDGGAWAYGAAMDGTPVDDVDLAGPLALVLGAEGRGLRPRVAAACDDGIAIPMVGRVDSLNVSAAAAVLLYAALRARR